MKIATIGAVLLSGFIVLLTLRATALLTDMSAPTPDLRHEDVEAGWLLPMYCGATFWSDFPGFPTDIESIVDEQAFAYAAICVVFVGLPLIIWRRRSFTAAAFMILPLGMIPSVVGAFVLKDRSASPEVAGAWIAVMVIGLLYLASFALVLAMVDLVLPRSWGTRLSQLSLASTSMTEAKGNLKANTSLAQQHLA